MQGLIGLRELRFLHLDRQRSKLTSFELAPKLCKASSKLASL